MDLPPEDQKKLRTSKKSVRGVLLGRLASAKCKPKRRRKDAQFGGMAVFSKGGRLPLAVISRAIEATQLKGQVTKTPEAPGKDHKRPKRMEETKAMQKVSHTPPVPMSQQSPACHQPLATHFVPFVAHFGGRQPNSFKFLFYKPSCSNSYIPFYTAQKPTCGYRYHRDTNHTRKVMDISSANIVKWRPNLGRRP